MALGTLQTLVVQRFSELRPSSTRDTASYRFAPKVPTKSPHSLVARPEDAELGKLAPVFLGSSSPRKGRRNEKGLPGIPAQVDASSWKSPH